MKRLKDTFTAKDSGGNQYKVRVYVEENQIHFMDGGHGGSGTVTGFASAIAERLDIPGSQFAASYVEGKKYRLLPGEIVITRD